MLEVHMRFDDNTRLKLWGDHLGKITLSSQGVQH